MIDDRSLTFSDVHSLVTFAYARDGNSFRQLSASIDAYARTAKGFNAGAAAAIARPLSEALSARMSSNPRKAVDRLLAARFDFPQMGGSNAQRDMLDILLIDCAVFAGDDPLARRLLNQYLDVRPGSVPMQSQLAAINDAAGARQPPR